MSHIEGQFLTFILKGQVYGVPIESVQEINRMIEITEVPRTSDFVKGVINLRGKVIPVVDLRLKFGMAEAELTRNSCIVVIEGDNGDIGIIVDAVNSVTNFSAEQVQPPPSMGNDEHINFVIGMGKSDDRVVILVDIVSCLSKDNLSKVVQVAPDDIPESEAA